MVRLGTFADLPESDYHADPDSLSVSGAKLILKSPALYRWRMDNPVTSDTFDLGHAAHKMVLGRGAFIREIKHDSWRTNEAKAEKEAAHAAGEIPLLSADVRRVEDMAHELTKNVRASELLNAPGEAEVSMFAEESQTGVVMRCRFDWLLPDLGVDYKSAQSSDPGEFGAACARFGYHQQHAFYLDVADLLGLSLRSFLFIAQMKEPPYLASVVELVPDAVERGRDLNCRALEMFRDCREMNLWPGYSHEITPIDIPRWAYYDKELA